MISQKCERCRAYPMGWCEYDFATDTVYPVDEQMCEEREDRGMAVFDLTAFAREVHENAKAHGWWETERDAAEVRALIHSEWSEALEEDRAGRPMVWHECMDAAQEKHPVICEECSDCICKRIDNARECHAYCHKPEGIAVELMDGVIRILDYLGKEGGSTGTMDEEMFLGCTCYAADFTKEPPVEKLKLPKLVDVLHYYTAQDAKTAGAYEVDGMKGHPDLEAAAGIAMAWVMANGENPVKVMREKHAYNKTRPYKHGKKF